MMTNLTDCRFPKNSLSKQTPRLRKMILRSREKVLPQKRDRTSQQDKKSECSSSKGRMFWSKNDKIKEER
jgi:hypothetical protein